MMSPTGLDQLIDEITVDAYNHEEQEAGFLVAAEESLVRRESAELAGTAVEVIRVDCGPDVRAGLRATVRAGGGTHEVALADLAFPDGQRHRADRVRISTLAGMALTSADCFEDGRARRAANRERP